MAGLAEIEIATWRGSLGLEPTPEMFVGHLVSIARELWRVLRKDGTFWLNLGDSYTSSAFSARPNGKGFGITGKKAHIDIPRPPAPPGLKPKDLAGIPWRVALALQADGWWLRSDAIWHKSNCVPESVTDRPTKGHEYVFLLTKSKRYFYDAEAIREPPGRNKRTVWTIPTHHSPGSHFATFPPKLVEPMILAGTSGHGCCPECGAPFERTRERTGHVNKREPAHCPNNNETKVDSTGWAPTTRIIDGWRPTCDCDTGDPIPCTVLDPFAGAGTVGLVALEHSRHCVLIELSEEYCKDHVVPRLSEPMQPRLGV